MFETPVTFGDQKKELILEKVLVKFHEVVR